MLIIIITIRDIYININNDNHSQNGYILSFVGYRVVHP